MISNKNTNKFTSFLTITFFIFSTFVHLAKFENNLYSPTDYTYYSNRTEIELVVSERTEYNLSFDKLNPTPKQVADFSFNIIDFSAIHKHFLIHFQNYVFIQLKFFDRTFIPQKQFISILENMWHHSSFELGNLVIG